MLALKATTPSWANSSAHQGAPPGDLCSTKVGNTCENIPDPPPASTGFLWKPLFLWVGSLSFVVWQQAHQVAVASEMRKCQQQKYNQKLPTASCRSARSSAGKWHLSTRLYAALMLSVMQLQTQVRWSYCTKILSKHDPILGFKPTAFLALKVPIPSLLNSCGLPTYMILSMFQIGLDYWILNPVIHWFVHHKTLQISLKSSCCGSNFCLEKCLKKFESYPKFWVKHLGILRCHSRKLQVLTAAGLKTQVMSRYPKSIEDLEKSSPTWQM